VKDPKTLKQLNAIKITKKTVAIEKKYQPAVIFGDGETWSSLEGATLLITDSELCGMAQEDVVDQTNKKYPDDETYGEYALDQLILDLPLETLKKYKVARTKAPPPVSVRGKK
jgi:hypothetical protein